MNESSSEVLAPASTELTAPASSTPKPSTAMARHASQAACEARVPRHTNSELTTAREAWACIR
ncbi:hypothetical protein OG275_36450 [Streptomyces niveus]|uniref:hypothetical protein n=1 Tax=Streptomyces niveus TaxID=193462 RepID=UPI002E30E29A|nr:hypothetical protein [Streptomyces niveus]